MKTIIGITGKSGAGKDTLSNYLVKKGYIKLSFGAALKDVISIITGWSRDFIEGTNEDRQLRETLIHPEYNKTCRELMQFIGTDMFRTQLNDNIWVNIIKNKIISDKINNKFVITDVRFDNEVEMIKSFDGIIIEIERFDNKSISNHISEKGISYEPDFLIENNSDINNLYDCMNHILKLIN
jgi:dephospho-CoA kinase